MTTDPSQPEEEGPSPIRQLITAGLRSRNQPVLWIIFTPVIALPLTWLLMGLVLLNFCGSEHVEFIGGWWSCPTGPIFIALAPGLLNLLPSLWLFAGDRTTRLAAIAGTILGGLRLIVPAVGVLVSTPSFPETRTGYRVISAGFVGPFPNSDSAVIGVVSPLLWLATVATFFLLRHRTWRLSRETDE